MQWLGSYINFHANGYLKNISCNAKIAQNPMHYNCCSRIFVSLFFFSLSRDLTSFDWQKKTICYFTVHRFMHGLRHWFENGENAQTN